MIIQHNMSADYADRMHGENQQRMNGLTKQLSSGYRLTNTKVDAAGATIAQGMRSQIRGLTQASDNAQDGVLLLDVAEGAGKEIQSMLHRLRELAVQAADDVNTSTERANIQEETDTIISEIDRIADETEYNTKKLIDGSLATTGHELKLQVGANSDQNIEILISSLRKTALGLDSIKMGSHAEADTMVDYAKESILGKSIVAMITQANVRPQNVVSLLNSDGSTSGQGQQKQTTSSRAEAS